jgi:hypothetical protein
MSATEIHSGIFRNWDLNIYESTQSFPQDGNLERKTIMNPNEPNDIDNDHFLTPGELVKKYGPRAYQNVVPANKEKHRDIFECKACGCSHQIQNDVKACLCATTKSCSECIHCARAISPGFRCTCPKRVDCHCNLRSTCICL